MNMKIPLLTIPNNTMRSFTNGANMAPIPNTIMMDTTHQGIKLPIGTRPSINMMPATNKRVASKFLILNALYDAEATKNANNANMVAERGFNS